MIEPKPNNRNQTTNRRERRQMRENSTSTSILKPDHRQYGWVSKGDVVFYVLIGGGVATIFAGIIDDPNHVGDCSDTEVVFISKRTNPATGAKRFNVRRNNRHLLTMDEVGQLTSDPNAFSTWFAGYDSDLLKTIFDELSNQWTAVALMSPSS